MFKRTLLVQIIALITSLSLILLLIITPGFSSQKATAATQQTVVRCEPEIIRSDLVSPVSFMIYVEDVVDLNATDVRMSFDPTIAQVVDADPDIPNTQIEILDEFLAPDFVLRKVADNEAGTIWYANTQVNPSPPVSGSGPLARVTLQPQKAGSFEMTFTNLELVLNNGSPIPVVGRDCQVSFIDPEDLEQTFLPVVFGS